MERYGQEQENKGFLINVTALLLASGGLGLHKDRFRGQRNPPSTVP
jgi:hypothetical protein